MKVGKGKDIINLRLQPIVCSSSYLENHIEIFCFKNFCFSIGIIERTVSNLKRLN